MFNSDKCMSQRFCHQDKGQTEQLKGRKGLVCLTVPEVSVCGQLVLLSACGETEHHSGKIIQWNQVADLMATQKHRRVRGAHSRICPSKACPSDPFPPTRLPLPTRLHLIVNPSRGPPQRLRQRHLKMSSLISEVSLSPINNKWTTAIMLQD